MPAARMNLLTDVPGVRIGNAHDERFATGVTVVAFDEPAVASLAVLGGAPAGRDTHLLEPEMTVERIDALVLSGGSAFGLDAAGGVMSVLAAAGRGFTVGGTRVPIVPQAALFDRGPGAAHWGDAPPYRRLGMAAARAAAKDFALGSVGAGHGATTVDLKGGLGSASALTGAGHHVGALVAVNAVGSAVIGGGPHFWAAPYEIDGEFGGLGFPARLPTRALAPRYKGGPGANTTIAVVATDAILTKAQAKRLALAAHDGLARALRPAHLPLDGDTVFAAAIGRRALGEPLRELSELCLVGADCLARAVARGVYEATALDVPNALPAWRDKFGA